jgi:hypothetical protein
MKNEQLEMKNDPHLTMADRDELRSTLFHC